MDRNLDVDRGGLIDARVALLAEGVDRNRMWSLRSLKAEVALLAEGVDRNSVYYALGFDAGVSPSSRRAWIEISASTNPRFATKVALLAEGVDRNGPRTTTVAGYSLSPSSRRAWIEIGCWP